MPSVYSTHIPPGATQSSMNPPPAPPAPDNSAQYKALLAKYQKLEEQKLGLTGGSKYWSIRHPPPHAPQSPPPPPMPPGTLVLIVITLSEHCFGVAVACLRCVCVSVDVCLYLWVCASLSLYLSVRAYTYTCIHIRTHILVYIRARQPKPPKNNTQARRAPRFPPRARPPN